MSSIANVLWSCESPALTNANAEHCIDIPLYFQHQIDSLTQSNPFVVKTVESNEDKETKEVQIKDWANELSSFLATDLNKPAYQGFITKDSTANKITYKLEGKNIDPTTVVIYFDSNRIDSLTIERQTKNILYQTSEKLKYVQDQSYSINKSQKVILLGINQYSIQGKFK